MKILSVIRTLNPEYGGPVSAVTSLLKCFSKPDYYSICSFDSIKSTWANNNNAYLIGSNFLKYGFNFLIYKRLFNIINQQDIVLVHGIWQYQSYVVRKICLRLNIPYVIFIHGALDPWFKTKYPLKHIKKLIYWMLIERKNLREAIFVIYTDKNELDLSIKAFPFYAANNAIFKYGIIDPYFNYSIDDANSLLFQKFPELIGKRVLLFMSRIDPKKGVDILIETF